MEKKNNKNKIIIGVVLIIIIIVIGILVYKNINNNTTSTSNWSKSKQEEKSNSSISKVENNSNSQNKEEEITLQDKITIDNFCEFNISSSSFSRFFKFFLLSHFYIGNCFKYGFIILKLHKFFKFICIFLKAVTYL